MVATWQKGMADADAAADADTLLPSRLHARAASVTSLTSGRDFVIATGLCGRLRAWRAPSPSAVATVSATSSRRVEVRVELGPAAGAEWQLVLDESSVYDLANDRKSSHPYRYVSEVTDDGRFAVATPSPLVGLQIWDSRSWKRLQTIEPAEEEGHRD